MPADPGDKLRIVPISLNPVFGSNPNATLPPVSHLRVTVTGRRWRWQHSPDGPLSGSWDWQRPAAGWGGATAQAQTWQYIWSTVGPGQASSNAPPPPPSWWVSLKSLALAPPAAVGGSAPTPIPTSLPPVEYMMLIAQPPGWVGPPIASTPSNTSFKQMKGVGTIVHLLSRCSGLTFRWEWIP
jgi:hypothetical protein